MRRAGNVRAKYYSSLTYNRTDGVFYGVDMNKITGRMNADYKLTNNLETGQGSTLPIPEGNDVPMQSLYYSNPIFGGCGSCHGHPRMTTKANTM